MAASLDDIVTAHKNLVIGTNNISQVLTSLLDQYTYLSGSKTSVTVSVPTVLATGAGRLASYNTVVAGSAGTINDVVAYNIASASLTAGVATIVYQGLKAFAVGESITIKGCGGYDGTFTVASQTPPATLTYALAGPLGTLTNQGVIYIAKASQVLTATEAVVGLHNVNSNFSNGLLVLPGTGQSVNLTYSLS